MLFPRPVAIYPWDQDWVTVLMVLGLGLASVVLLYLSMRQGRIEKRDPETPGEPRIHHYAGIISSDSHPIPVFIWTVIVICIVWVIAYNVNVAIHGMGY